MTRFPRALALIATLTAFAIAGCGSSTSDPERTERTEPVLDRIDAIGAAIDRWASAEDITEAHRAAETALNLTAGPGTRFSGDADGDGVVGGAEGEGLLPGEDGAGGIALALADCAGPDLLGGSWADPVARWETFAAAYQQWRPDNNTFPTLPAHPQRIVGWALLALASTDLGEAHEYAGHARLHEDASRAAATCS